MLEKLMVNPYAWLFLSVLSIFSVAFGIYTWIKGKEKKEFSYFHVSHAIVRGGKKIIPAIKFTFNGIEINNLTSTKIAIWNSGNTVINKGDIVTGRELNISTKENAEILSVEIIAESESTNKFTLSEMTDSTQGLSFDYADKREGVVLQIFHTGDHDDLNVSCKIKGGQPAKNVNQKIKKSRLLSKVDPQKVLSVMCDILAGYLSIFAFIVVFAWFNPTVYQSIYSAEPVSQTANNVLGIICVGSTIFIDLLSYKMTRNAFRLSVPNELRKHM